MKKLVSLVLSFIAVSAYSQTNSTQDKTGSEGDFVGQAYVTEDADTFANTADQLKGSGTIIFKNAVGEIAANKNYLLRFRLEDGGSLKLSTAADNRLQNGITIEFIRSGTKLKTILSAQSVSTEAREVQGLNADGLIALSLDVHNEENPTHILFWSAEQNNYSADAALFNSERDIESPGQGQGSYWGLGLNKATVETALLGEPKFSEE